MWKAYMPRLMTLLMDQISEHQRDLTNSASMRFVTEFVAALAYSVHRTQGALAAVEPNVARMREILDEGKHPVVAEPLYVLLALAGHPEAHEQARVLSRKALASKVPLTDLIKSDSAVAQYLHSLTPQQKAILDDPARYRGAAAETSRRICDAWEQHLPSISID
jgi:adenylosuccinate lyase